MQPCCSDYVSESPQISQFTNHNWTKKDEGIPLTVALLQRLSSPRKEGRLARLATLRQPARAENVRCSTTHANTFSCALVAAKLQREIGMISTFREEALDLASPLSRIPCVVPPSTVGVINARRVKHIVTYLQGEGADCLAFLFTALSILAEVKKIHLIVTGSVEIKKD